MKKIYLAFLSLGLLNFSSCAKLTEKFGRLDGGSTKVFFTSDRSSLHSMSSLNGGVLVYIIGMGSSFKKTLLFSNEDIANGSASVTLSNGSYKFHLVGFSNSNMLTGVKCASGNGNSTVNLIGASQTISFNASAANCDAVVFSPGSNATDPSTGFKPLEFISCASGTSLTGFTETSICSASKGDLNHTRSVKVELVSYDSASGPVSETNHTAGISSACIRGNGKPSSNAIYTTTDTQANSAFTLNSGLMFFGLNGDGIIKNIITSGSNGFSVASAIGAVNEIHGSGSTLAAATNTAGIYYSSDSGTTWSASNISTGAFWSVFVESASSLWAGRGTAGNFYRSTNGGANWTLVAAQANHGITSVETIFVADDGTIYAGGTNGSNAILAFSTDLGSTWTNNTFTGTSQGGVWVIKKLNGYLYWGTNNGLFRSANANASASVHYCNTGCTNTGTIPGNSVQDVTINNNTLYVATSAGIGVNPNVDLTTWENYTATELIAGNLNIQQISFNNGKLYQAVLGPSDDPIRSTNSRGSGLAFPTTSKPFLPLGNAGSFLATKVTTYSDPACLTASTVYFYPEGLSGSGSISPNTTSSASRFGAGNTNNSFFFNDL